MLNEVKDNPSKDFSIVNETGPGHKVIDAVRYMTMMIMIIIIMMLMKANSL
jgi:hypothetical protein